jgi:hypothetical protein
VTFDRAASKCVYNATSYDGSKVTLLVQAANGQSHAVVVNTWAEVTGSMTAADVGFQLSAEC